MTARYDICTGREDRDGKTRWTKIGVMFPAKSGDGFAVKLDALPLPNKDGDVWLKAFVPREKDDAPSQESRVRSEVDRHFGRPSGMPEKPRNSGPLESDEIPF